MNQIATRVYNKMTVKRVHRIRMLSQAITEGANTNKPLLTCDDDPDYDLTTDGSNVAECQPGAKIIAVQLHATITAPSTRVVEWIIGRDQDGALQAAGLFTIAQLYTADVNSGSIQNLRKNIWGAGHFVTTDRTGMNTSMNITKALRRSSRMADGDTIRMQFTDDGGGTGDAQLYLRGRIITRGP